MFLSQTDSEREIILYTLLACIDVEKKEDKNIQFSNGFAQSFFDQRMIENQKKNMLSLGSCCLE
jgi:hypothetical protein